MGTAFKTDVDAVAAAYLKNPVNNNINPYSSGWTPAYVNTALLGPFSGDPAESHPSISIGGSLKGNDLRTSMIALGQYYGWITRGHYGILTTDSTTGYFGYNNQGSGYFVLNNSAPGAGDHFNRVNNDLNIPFPPTGTAYYQNLIDFFAYAWNVINNHKDDMDADLTVCHSSCHTSCHGSRGRR